MATFESGGFSMALKKIATDSAESAYNPILKKYGSLGIKAYAFDEYVKIIYKISH